MHLTGNNPFLVRACVQPGYEEEILIPYSNLLKYGSVVQGEVTAITPTSVSIHGHKDEVKFDYLIIATGSSYAFPGKLAETKMEDAVERFKVSQKEIAGATKIAIVGGGPVGVELAGCKRSLFVKRKICVRVFLFCSLVWIFLCVHCLKRHTTQRDTHRAFFRTRSLRSFVQRSLARSFAETLTILITGTHR